MTGRAIPTRVHRMMQAELGCYGERTVDWIPEAKCYEGKLLQDGWLVRRVYRHWVREEWTEDGSSRRRIVYVP